MTSSCYIMLIRVHNNQVDNSLPVAVWLPLAPKELSEKMMQKNSFVLIVNGNDIPSSI